MTNKKSQAMSETLKGLKYFVSPGDTMLVLNGAPMMNYLTHTRPFGSILWFISSSELSVKLQGVSNHPPKVLLTKFKTDDKRWDIPMMQSRYTGVEKYIPSSSFIGIDDFLARYRYYKVFENDYFVLFLLDNRQ